MNKPNTCDQFKNRLPLQIQYGKSKESKTPTVDVESLSPDVRLGQIGSDSDDDLASLEG